MIRTGSFLIIGDLVGDLVAFHNSNSTPSTAPSTRSSEHQVNFSPHYSCRVYVDHSSGKAKTWIQLVIQWPVPYIRNALDETY